MKNVAAYFSKTKVPNYPFNEPGYFKAYLELSQEIEALGAGFFVVWEGTYLGSGAFSQSWKITENGLVEHGPVVADAVYDKGAHETIFRDRSVPVLNCPEVNDICIDKWKTFQAFKKYSPGTWLAQNSGELTQAITQCSTEKIVVKPIDGGGGKGIVIGTGEEVMAQSELLSYPVIAQEFMDTSTGIPGIIDTYHDFRIVIIDGSYAYSYVRTPPKGSFTANVAQGGSFAVVEKDRVPSVFWEVVDHVDSVLSAYGSRLYSIDLGLTPEGPKIIELNSRVGLLDNSEHACFVQFKKTLAQKLLDLSTAHR